MKAMLEVRRFMVGSGCRGLVLALKYLDRSYSPGPVDHTAVS